MLEERVTPAGLVAAFAFNEGTGGTVADSSGNVHTGTITSATWSAAGRFGNALSFNGTDAWVTVNDSSLLDLTNAMTLEAWIRPTAINDWETVILKERSGGLAYALYGGSAAGPPASYITRSGTSSDIGVNAAQTLPLNAWSHLASTYDGAMLRLYIDGNLVSSQAAPGSVVTSSDPLRIGGNAAWGEYFAGLIDEVRIYDRVLSESEIEVDMNTPVGGTPTDTEPPTVSLLTPSNGAVLSHVATFTATAADNLGVASVEFFVDGGSVGIDYTAPYSTNWDSTSLPNGPHVITAVARDASGNATTSDPVSVTTVNSGFVNEVVVPGIADATTIAFLPDGRMLVGKLSNKVLLVQPGANAPDPQPLLDLGYSDHFGEQGLMDIAVDPAFAQNGYIYIYYTKGFSGSLNRNRLSRFTLNGNAVAPGSEFVLWQDNEIARHEHHGGAIAFGNDGKIYFTTGDEFIAQNAELLNNYWGKVLRINLDGTVPLDNPFHDGDGPNKDAIWAYGLRNPFRMSIDPLTGRMYIGDVGGNDNNTAVEEINLGVAGANYGWPSTEGNTGNPGITSPIFSYPHNGRDGAVMGGIVYRASQFPSEYYGSYFFADYAQNTIRRLTFDGAGNVTNDLDFLPADGSPDQPLPGDPVKFVHGPDGSLYYVDLGFDGYFVPNDAAIRRIRYVGANQPPVVVATGNPTTGLPPLTVNFSSAGSYDLEGGTLSYAWDFGDGATSNLANPTHAYTSAGPYLATLTVSDGASFTLSDNIEITVGTRPVPTIQGPADGSFFRAGDVIAFSGIATDAEDGDLPASAFSWEIRFHHEGHIHPAGVLNNTQSGTLPIPTTGHDFQGATSYEIVLRVTDSTGLTGTTSVTVLPEKINLTFDTNPSGLTIQIDGISRQVPFVLDSLVGFHYSITAPNQASGGFNYVFQGWSDGLSQSHEIIVPTSGQSYVASFEVPVALPGDYNADQLVNAADYVAWRKFSDASAILPNDTTPGSVTIADYNLWQQHFGAIAAGQGPERSGGDLEVDKYAAGNAVANDGELDQVAVAPQLAITWRAWARKQLIAHPKRDLVPTAAARDALLLAESRTRAAAARREATPDATTAERSNESPAGAGARSFTAIDSVFAELGLFYGSEKSA